MDNPNPLIVRRADGTFIRVKRVTVHVDYVDENGSPRANADGAVDTGNYALNVEESVLSQFPLEMIQGLAAIYDTASIED